MRIAKFIKKGSYSEPVHATCATHATLEPKNEPSVATVAQVALSEHDEKAQKKLSVATVAKVALSGELERKTNKKAGILTSDFNKKDQNQPARLVVSNKAIITPSVNNRRPVLHIAREIIEDGQVKKISYTLIGKSGESIETALKEHSKRFPGQQITMIRGKT